MGHRWFIGNIYVGMVFAIFLLELISFDAVEDIPDHYVRGGPDALTDVA